jgi:hypothetical protein
MWRTIFFENEKHVALQSWSLRGDLPYIAHMLFQPTIDTVLVFLLLCCHRKEKSHAMSLKTIQTILYIANFIVPQTTCQRQFFYVISK